MKNILIFAISFLIAFQLHAQQPAKRFAIKSGKIEYKLSGNTTGTKTMYFDDFGDKTFEHEKSVTETKMFGITDRSEVDRINIFDNGHYWSIDNITKQNNEGTHPYYKASKDMTKNMSDAELEKMGDDLLKSFGGEKLGTEKVLGYDCEKIKVMGSYSWIYKGVVLKSESKVMGIVANEEAVKFEKNISIPSSKFAPPAGLSFTNIDMQQQAMFGGMEMYEEGNNDDESNFQAEPVNYPFDKFQKVINSFTPEGFIRTIVLSQEGQHMAMYNQGFASIISVVATSMQDFDQEKSDELNQFEKFNHNGKAMYYGDLEEDGTSGKALLIPYNQYDMYIFILSVPGADKNTMVKWSDELDF